MGRPPSNGGPSFRFNSAEVAEMDTILQAHDCAMPSREVLEALAEKFNLSAERSGKIVVQMKQVWHWFQNRRYALRAKAARAPGTVHVSPPTQDDSSIVKNVPHSPQPKPSPQETVINVPQALQRVPAPATEFKSSYVGSKGADNILMDFEAKSARDGAWYDVAMFLSHRNIEAMDPEVLVRFAGFGSEEDEWVNIGRLVRKRSLPCESSECVAVLQGDLILCFQEGKEQALYFDAHVLDAQRRRHDVRGCRCRFLVRYDHDQSEEIVPLRKVCRRPETDYRLQQLHALNESTTTNQLKAGAVPRADNSLRAYPPAEPTQKQRKIEDLTDVLPVLPAASQSNLPAVNENEVQQPKDTDVVNAGNPENSSAAQPQVAEIISPNTLGTSDVASVIKQPEVTVIIDGANPENIIAQEGIISQQEVAESSANLENSDTPPGIVIQQEKIAEGVDAGNPETSYVPPLNVIPTPKVEEISGSLESTLVPPGNAV